MAKPLVLFTDVTAGVLDLLRAGLAARDDAYIGDVTVSAKVPTGKVPDKGLPLVVVRHDGTPASRYPVDETATVRVTVWHRDEPAAVRLAQLCRGLILTTRGTDLVRATRPLTGPVPAADPDTGEPIATFTVAVHPRPLPA